MKKFIFFMCIITALLTHINAYGTIYYVDSEQGDNGYSGLIYTDAFATITYAITQCGTNDTIRLMDGDFVEDRHQINAPGTDPWDGERYVQIFVDESITIERWDGDPTIIGFNYDYYPEEDDHELYDIMDIDQPNVVIQNITFDGYHIVLADTFYVKVHNNVFMTPDADGTQILNCNFTNFGNDDWNQGNYDFYSIVGGGWADTSAVPPNNSLDNIKINDNDFYNNPFESWGAHEIYLTYSTGAEIKRNDITNNCSGHPLKLRDDCLNIVFEDNIVRGGNYCFLGDYPNENEGYSSNTTVKGNSFIDNGSTMADSISYYTGIGGNWVYKGPFNIGNHITTFENNTIFEFSADDQHYVHGITYKSSANDLYITEKRGTRDEVTILPNIHAPSPATGYGIMDSLYFCQGDMCTTNGYVIFCGQNSAGQQIVYSDNIDGNLNSTNIFNNTSYPNIKITALTSLGLTTYLTAIRDTGNQCVRIYESTHTAIINGIPKLTRAFADADSITAMAYDGSYVVFTEYKNGTSRIRKAALASLGSPTDIETVSGYIPAMCFAKGSLVTAYKNGSTRRIYIGTLNDAITGTYDTLASKNFIALVGNSDYLYTVMHNDTGGNERKKGILQKH